MLSDSENAAIDFKQPQLLWLFAITTLFALLPQVQNQLCVYTKPIMCIPCPKSGENVNSFKSIWDFLGKISEKILQKYIVVPNSYFSNNNLLFTVSLGSPNMKKIWRGKKGCEELGLLPQAPGSKTRSQETGQGGRLTHIRKTKPFTEAQRRWCQRENKGMDVSKYILRVYSAQDSWPGPLIS